MTEIPNIDEFIAEQLAIQEISEKLHGSVKRMKNGEAAEEVDPETLIEKAIARHKAKHSEV